MNRATIYLLRHAEKPDPRTGIIGVDEDGTPDKHSLSKRGWYRAGVLGSWLLDPANIPLPIERVFAARPNPSGKKSKRSEQTVMPFARKAGLLVDTTYEKGDESRLGKALNEVAGISLVSWTHEQLPGLVRAVAKGVSNVPADWPSDRFDVLWILERDDDGSWRFSQRPQRLFPEDRGSTIAS